MSILHVSDYFSNVQKHVPHMLSQEGIDLMHYMRANLKGKLHPPTDSFREETDKLFFLIPWFLSSNGTLGVIGKTLEKAWSIFYAPDLPYLNTGPVEEKLELLYAKFTNIMQAHPDKKLILIWHSMWWLLAEEVARMYYTETKQKVHQIIPIGTPHGIPDIAKLVKNCIVAESSLHCKFLKCWHKIGKRFFEILEFFTRCGASHTESVVFLCSIVVVSPEFKRVSVGFNIIIPLPEITTVLFHGSMVSFYLSVMLRCVGRILVMFYMVFLKKLLHFPWIFSSLISSYSSNREWNLGDEIL